MTQESAVRFPWTLAAGAVLAAACASIQPARLSTNPSIPGAEGTVKVSETVNGNTNLDVDIRHLPPPDKLTPPGATYVVWSQSTSGSAQNVGALKVDSDLNAKLTAITPLRSFELFITTESAPTAASPNGQRLLWTTINR